MHSIRRGRLRIVAGCSFAALALLAAALPLSTAHAGLSGVSAVLADGVLQVTGRDRADAITLRVRPGDPAVIEVLTGLTRPPEFVFRRAATERITVESAAGDDRLTVDDRFGALGAELPITITTGEGNDTVTAGHGDQVVLAGAGDDVVDPGPGDDHLLLGGGNDRVLWTTAYDSDVVEGQTGADQIVADGASTADHLEVNAVGSRIRLSRPGQPGTVETASVEDWRVRPAGGADTVVVNDLTGAPLAALALDLDSAGGGSSDGSADDVTVAGTAGADDIRVEPDGSALEITGTPQRVRVSGADHFVDLLVVDADLGSDTLRASPVVGDLLPVRLEGGPGQDVAVVDGTPLKDDLSVGTEDGRIQVNQSGDGVTTSAEQTTVNGLGGDDLLRVVSPVEEITDLAVDGGTGTDSLSGSADQEVLIGGEGDDQLIGGGGDDVVFGGAGNDHV
ncbi:MAG TPA: hypothetical protein VFU98_08970, partial [Microlunatus sp.]|nr:hypothetical protein [Microlunatus sp.]